MKKSKALTPEKWERKYGDTRQKRQFTIINAFDALQLNSADISQLMPLHERVYLFQENSSIIDLPAISSSTESIFPKKYALPASILQKLVKDNLELICLLFLEKNPQSGYQLIKNLAQHFHVVLSQGTLYPMLYNLEKRGEIMATKGKGREMIYELSLQAKNEMEGKKQQSMQGYQHLASFFE